MNESDLYYKKLKNKSTVWYHLCNSAIKNLTEEDRKKLKNRADFKVIKVNKETFLQEPILKKLNDHFEISFAAIFVLEKNIGCNFHVDEPRNVAINMLLSSGLSHSIFKKKKELDNSYQYEFEELIFEEKVFYLYNVSEEHCVLNFDKPRFMFSIKFKNGKLTYEELFNWCKENNMFESTHNE